MSEPRESKSQALVPVAPKVYVARPMGTPPEERRRIGVAAAAGAGIIAITVLIALRIAKRSSVALSGADDELDAAFRAAEDGDCRRMEKHLDRAEAEGANVAAHRRQLSRQCAAGELHGTEEA